MKKKRPPAALRGGAGALRAPLRGEHLVVPHHGLGLVVRAAYHETDACYVTP